MTLKEIVENVDLTVEEVADYLDIPYFNMAQILKGKQSCSRTQKEMLKFFLIQNYTKCIEEAVSTNYKKEVKAMNKHIETLRQVLCSLTEELQNGLPNNIEECHKQIRVIDCLAQTITLMERD